MHERRRRQDILRKEDILITEEGNRKTEKQGKDKRKKQIGEEMKLGNTTICYYDICFISSLISVLLLFVLLFF